MANIDLYKQKLVAIGNAIRQKLSESDTYKLEEMPEKILSIETGGSSIEIIESYWYSDVPIDKSMTSYDTFSSISIGNGYSVVTVTKV